MDAKYIISFIERLGMSQTELAKKSGIAFATLNRILNGKQKLLPNTAQKIADALGIGLFDLMDDDMSIPQENTNVSGYLEYGGEITKIKSLKQLEKYVAQIKVENEIPTKARKIIKDNELNRKRIIASQSNAMYKFDIDDFESITEYDCSVLDCWSWKIASEVKDGIQMDLGNQCSGYEFDFKNKHFYTNESFYLCGQFSQSPSDELTRIQYQLLYEKNGFTAKKKIKNSNKALIRKDWEEIAPHWMMFVCWEKCKHNQAFAEKLKAMPRNAILMENSTTIDEYTSSVWGTKNVELEEARNIVEKYAESQYLKMAKQNGLRPRKEEINAYCQSERNKIHYIGTFKEGKNYMGKILKRCQLALLDGNEPNINYDLLREKKIYLFGELLTFENA